MNTDTQSPDTQDTPGMHLYTVQFDYAHAKYERLLNVFRRSVHHHMPDTYLIEDTLTAPARTKGVQPNFTDNTAKLAAWVAHAQETDEPTIFCDCDMLMIRPAYHAFDPVEGEPDFDVAVTFAETGRFPMNGGIVLMRPTDRARQFFRQWQETNDAMLADREWHRRWQRKYAAMNQSAFGYLYETGQIKAKVKRLRTRHWNAIGEDWPYIDQHTVFVHIKSQLRNFLMANREPVGDMAHAMRLWYAERDRRDNTGGRRG